MGLPLPLLNLRRRLAGGISPAALFLNSEPGVWYDPSDLTTMFQDRAGATPVTAPGQTVGLVLDKSRGLVLGPELVTNGTFDTDISGWTNSSTGTGSIAWNPIGAINLTGTDASNRGRASQIITCVTGRTYRIQWSASGAAYNIAIGTLPGGTSMGSFSSGGSAYFTASQTNVTVTALTVSAGGTVTFDNISVREIPGNHMVATADASRGTYGIEPFGGRRNLLTFTEQFDNAAWVNFNTTETANAGVSPDGATTAEKLTLNSGQTLGSTFQVLTGQSANTAYSGSVYMKAAEFSFADLVLVARNNSSETGRNIISVNLTAGTGVVSSTGTAWASVSSSITDVGNGWWRVALSGLTPPNTNRVDYALQLSGVTGDGTSGILIWGAQLEVGSTATPYQRVTTAFDVTEAGVPTVHYVQFDGADDGYLTSTITPGTDKVQVFAGVQRLTNQSFPILVELSADANFNNGAFALFTDNNTRQFAFDSKGTTLRRATSSVAPANPVTVVLSGLGDIVGDRSTIRVNGTQVAQNAGDQGTGNYLAYPLYIGRRGGTTLPFNGRLYQMVVRFGPNLDAARIEQVERFINSKTGAY